MKNDKDKIENVLRKIEKFLEVKLHGGGDWVEIPQDVFRELGERIREIITTKFGVDVDGWTQIDFKMVDRKKGSFLYTYLGGDHIHNLKTVDEVDAEVERVMVTLEQASKRLQDLIFVRKDMMNSLDKKK